DQADAGAGVLHDRHQREGDQGGPQGRVAERGAGDRVGADAGRVVVGGAGDQAGAEHAQEAPHGVPRGFRRVLAQDRPGQQARAQVGGGGAGGLVHRRAGLGGTRAIRLIRNATRVPVHLDTPPFPGTSSLRTRGGLRAMDGAPACRLSLVIPAYNEAAGIAETVVEADAALRRLGLSYEILVVDDGSQDGTAEAVAPSERVRLLRHETNRGYGAALRTGFEAARGERVAFTDADGQFDLGDLARLLPLTETCAIAVGCRARRHDPWLRKFYSRGYNLLVRTLLGTGVRDVDCALKVYRRDALEQLLPESTDFFVNTEMLTRARQLGLSVAEIDVAHRPRRR